MPVDRNDMYRDSNMGTMEYAKNAIQFSFLLNGAAATALFAKAGGAFVFPASVLAVGAAFATLCMGISYVAQLLLTETWHQKSVLSGFIVYCGLKISLIKIEIIRFSAIFFWLLSMISFFCGIYLATQVKV